MGIISLFLITCVGFVVDARLLLSSALIRNFSACGILFHVIIVGYLLSCSCCYCFCYLSSCACGCVAVLRMVGFILGRVHAANNWKQRTYNKHQGYRSVSAFTFQSQRFSGPPCAPSCQPNEPQPQPGFRPVFGLESDRQRSRPSTEHERCCCRFRMITLSPQQDLFGTRHQHRRFRCRVQERQSRCEAHNKY